MPAGRRGRRGRAHRAAHLRRLRSPGRDAGPNAADATADPRARRRVRRDTAGGWSTPAGASISATTATRGSTSRPPLTPSPLGEGHTAGAHELEAAHRERGLDVVRLAPGFVYGAGRAVPHGVRRPGRRAGCAASATVRTTGAACTSTTSPAGRRRGAHRSGVAAARTSSSTTNHCPCARSRTCVASATGRGPVGTAPPALLGLLLGRPLVASLVTSFRMRSDRIPRTWAGGRPGRRRARRCRRWCGRCWSGLRPTALLRPRCARPRRGPARASCTCHGRAPPARSAPARSPSSGGDQHSRRSRSGCSRFSTGIDRSSASAATPARAAVSRAAASGSRSAHRATGGGPSAGGEDSGSSCGRAARRPRATAANQ